MAKLYCGECKGSNISVLAWVDANTNEYQEDGPAPNEIHCDDCERFTKVITGTEMKCIDCHGSGTDESVMEDCPTCSGTGKIIDFD